MRAIPSIEPKKSLSMQVPNMIILPVYSSLPSEMYLKRFEFAPTVPRRIIITSHIADSSITTDGICYATVDSGFVKQYTRGSSRTRSWPYHLTGAALTVRRPYRTYLSGQVLSFVCGNRIPQCRATTAGILRRLTPTT